MTANCLCGAVTMKLTGPCQGCLMCHCSDCRKWTGSTGNAANLWPSDKVEVTGKLLEFHKTPDSISYRKVCAKCYGAVLIDHTAAMNMIDVCGGLLPRQFEPAVHDFYEERILPMKDGLPKVKDLPKEFGGSGETVPESTTQDDADRPTKFQAECFCGAVKVDIEGAPVVQALCHCSDCRQWTGGPFMAVTLYKTDAVKITGDVLTFQKTPESISLRKVCAKCFGNVVNSHPAMDMIDVCGGILPGNHKPTMHLHYSEKIMRVVDGLPKFEHKPEAFGGTGAMVAE